VVRFPFDRVLNELVHELQNRYRITLIPPTRLISSVITSSRQCIVRRRSKLQGKDEDESRTMQSLRKRTVLAV
jgi:hypothetical protein